MEKQMFCACCSSFDHTRGVKVVFARASNYVRTVILGVNVGYPVFEYYSYYLVKDILFLSDL